MHNIFNPICCVVRDLVLNDQVLQKKVENQRQILFVTLLISGIASLFVSLGFAFVYSQTPTLPALVLSISFFIEVLICTWGLLTIDKNSQLVKRVFLASGSFQVFAFLLANSHDEFFLVGISGATVIVTLSSMLENPKSAYFWIGLQIFFYSIALITRFTVDPLTMEQIQFSQTAHLFISLIPGLVLILSGIVIIIAMQYQQELLQISEDARTKLVAQEKELIKAKDNPS